MRPSISSIVFFFCAALHSTGQTLVTPAERWSTKMWDAHWVTAAEGSPTQGVFLFRKTFALFEKPIQFIIHISADNRYRLFVNGKYVNEGPQLSDLRHWRFESIDIASLMQTGLNVIAVQVWNQGTDAPLNQMGKQPGLIVQGDNQVAAGVNTDKSWKCIINTGFSPIVFKAGDPELYSKYYAAGPMDKIDGKKSLWDWEKAGFDDKKWSTATELQTGAPFLLPPFGDAQWELMPRNIPWMERKYQSFASVRRAIGMTVAIKDFNTAVTLPPKQKVTLLFDQGRMTTAFPELIISKGEGRQIKLTYAEAMIDDIRDIGHRDSIRGKTIHGVYDLITPDGADHRVFSTLSYRAFRFLQMDISAGDTPLVIEKFGSWFTAYPFERKGSFVSNDSALSKVFNVGWHTARLCANETYMDCPYWERLQYIGDTRIQALVSYYVSGDDRLARNAIEQFEWSLEYDGLTNSRYPSSLPQYIPNYSLVWVAMVYDYFQYRHDMKFVQARLPNVRRVLEHFQKYLTNDKLMGLQPYWDFLDHSYDAKKITEGSENKALTSNTLFYAYVLAMAAQIESYFGEAGKAAEYARLSEDLKTATREKCWDAPRGLFADSPDKKHFSMHSNILAILCNMMPIKEQKDLLKIITNDNTITRTTLYFDFYLGRAMSQAEAGDQYHQLLEKWKALLKLGLTTFPEGMERSECHAWSASPDFEMLATICGIGPDAPGFEKILVKPQLDDGERVKGTVPHWSGKIEAEFTRTKNELRGRVVLPMGITGRLLWMDRELILRPGGNTINLKPVIETILKKK